MTVLESNLEKRSKVFLSKEAGMASSLMRGLRAAFGKGVKKKPGYNLRKGLKDEVMDLKKAIKVVLTEPMTKEHLKAYSRHSALNAGVAARQLRYPFKYPGLGKIDSVKRRLVDLLNSSAFTLMPPTHHPAGELATMAKGVGSHKAWFKQGYKPWKYPDPEKFKTAGLSKRLISLAKKKNFKFKHPPDFRTSEGEDWLRVLAWKKGRDAAKELAKRGKTRWAMDSMRRGKQLKESWKAQKAVNKSGIGG